MSNRAAEYRELIEDVVSGGLLEEDEWLQLRDLVARVIRKIDAKAPPPAAEESAA